jgi:hypothetical protein
MEAKVRKAKQRQKYLYGLKRMSYLRLLLHSTISAACTSW